MPIQRLLQRLAVAVGVAVAVGLASAGCGALDELDKANELIGAGKAEKPTANKPNEAKRRGLDWSDAKTVTSGELDASIVRCTIDGSVTFTRTDDCVSQGGTPGKI